MWRTFAQGMLVVHRMMVHFVWDQRQRTLLLSSRLHLYANAHSKRPVVFWRQQHSPLIPAGVLRTSQRVLHLQPLLTSRESKCPTYVSDKTRTNRIRSGNFSFCSVLATSTAGQRCEWNVGDWRLKTCLAEYNFYIFFIFLQRSCQAGDELCHI